jgi:hypothetical protein
MALLMAFVQRLGQNGYLIVDAVIVEKAPARRLPWAGWTYRDAQQRQLYGRHIVVLLWVSHEGAGRSPVGFRLWRPKRSCRPGAYRAKLQLVEPWVEAAVAAGLAVDYVALDGGYSGGKLTKKLARLGLPGHGVWRPHTIVYWKGMRAPLWLLAEFVAPRWRSHLGLRAIALTVEAPTYGQIRVVVTRNRHGAEEFLACNARTCDLTTMVRRKRSRWAVETLFRDAKQYGGLAACQSWVDQAMVRHVALALLGYVVLQMLRQRPAEPLAAVKERWQLVVLCNGVAPPPPLRACPPNSGPPRKSYHLPSAATEAICAMIVALS